MKTKSKKKEPKFTPSEFVAALHGLRGVQHFDAGGGVQISPSNRPSYIPEVNPNQNPNPAAAAAASPVINPANYILPSAVNGVQGFAAPLDSANQSIFNHAGGIAQGFAGAFTPQNTYSANLAPTTQTDYSGVINNSATNSLNGAGAFNNNIANENALAGQLVAQGRGIGPNPAQNMLNQATGNNVANTSALIGSSRGAGANAGLIARQAANAGAGIQQNAAGQAATLGAQQQLASQSAAGQLFGQIGNEVTGEQGVNNSLFSAATGAQNAQNSGNINNYSMAQGINSQVAQNNTNAVGKTESGLLGGASSLLSFLAKGGMVKGYDNGGMIQVPSLTSSGSSGLDIPNPSSLVGKFLNRGKGGSSGGTTSVGDTTSGVGPVANGDMYGAAISGMAKGGKVPALLSPGEEYLSPEKAKAVAQGKASPLSGKRVPGKAKVKGDDYKNDTVPAKLDEGGIVIPRHVMQSKDPAEGARKFVAAVMAKQGMRRKAA